MTYIYKTLFEIKLMHEFFLTNQQGQTPFELTDQQQRLAFVIQSFTDDLVSVNEELEYDFPESLKSTYENYGLKLITSYSGCKVAIQVNQTIGEDQSLKYQPTEDLPPNFSVVVLLSRKNNSIDRYTNSRLGSAVPFTYFFSNEALPDAKTAPFLTAAIPDFNDETNYEQGELALFNGTDIREYYNDGTTDQWESVTGTGFASEADRILARSGFNYSFPATASVTEASFVLKNFSGETVKTITVNQSDALQKVNLNFSGLPDFLSGAPADPLKNSLYTLEVTGNNSYSKKYNLLFGDNILEADTWGAISMKPIPEDDAFRLIAPDGFLIKRRDALGIWTQAPVFEIPLKSRFVYWRYMNDKGRELKLDPGDELADYLFKENLVLLTKKPRPMAKSWLLLRKEGTTDTKYVPNPVGYELNRDNRGRLCFTIRVPQSDLFPVI